MQFVNYIIVLQFIGKKINPMIHILGVYFMLREHTGRMPKNLEAGMCLGHVTNLGCARAHVILGVTLETTSPNEIG